MLKFRKAKNIENILVFTTETDIHTNNEKVRRLANQWHFVHGLYWINELAFYPQIDERIIGAKYHGAWLEKPIMPGPLLEYLEKQEAVLMVHCGRYKEANIMSNTSYQHPLRVAQVYPRLKVIMAHMGGTDTAVCKRAIHDSTDYDNVYFDTSGITTPYIIEYALARISPTRVLFGSDAPWCSFDAMVATVKDAHISDYDRNLILYENFNQLLCESQPKQSREKLPSAA